MKKLFPAGLAAILIVLLVSCSSDPAIRGREDILDMDVAVLSGSVTAGLVERMDPDLRLVLCDGAASLKEALKSGRADCAVVEESAAEKLTGFLSGLTTAGEPYADLRYSAAVSEDNTLMLEKLDAAIAELRSDGTLREILERPRDPSSGGEEETPGGAPVVVAVEPDFFPLAYYDGEGRLAGIEIDVVRALCEKLGLTPVFLPVEADMLLYTAQSGKCAFALGRLTPEEGQGLAYTDSYMHSTQLIVVRK